MKTSRIAITFLFVIASGAWAQEWNRFRGPNGSGIGKIEHLPAEITSMDYEWVAKIKGHGHSSPVLWDTKIFITSTDRENIEGSARTVHCYDSTNGKKLWEWTDPLEGHNLHKFNNFASATPTVDGERLYIVWGSGQRMQAVALSHSGGVIWRKEWPGFTSDHGHGASPILVNNVLVFHTDSKDNYRSYVLGLNPETGEELWKVERITPSADKKHFSAYNTPVTMKLGGKDIVVTLQSNDGWKGIDPLSGNVVWQAPGGYNWRSVGSVVSAKEGYLFATFGSGGAGKHATALKVDAEGAKEVYSLGIKDGLSYVPTALVHDGLIYLWGDGGILTCRDLITGDLVYRERIGGNFFSSPILADGKIIAASLDGELVMVEASREFKILGRSRLEGGVHATPAVANGCLFIRTNTHMMCICGK